MSNDLYFIGVDPGVKYCAVAVLTPNGGLFTQYFEEASVADLATAVECFITRICSLWPHGTNYPCTVKSAIEVPRSYPHSSVRVNDLIDLAYYAGCVAAALPNVQIVHPKMWKGSVPKDVHQKRLVKDYPEIGKIKSPGKQHKIDAAGLAYWLKGVQHES